MKTSTFDNSNLVVFVKGASEIVLSYCTRFLNAQGEVQDMSEMKRTEISKNIMDYAASSLRTIILAYKEIPASDKDKCHDADFVESELICIGLIGILDPLRDGVKESIA